MAKPIPFSLTFDDVLLKPKKSAVLPKEVSLQTSFSEHIDLTIPLVSAAMDRVTEAQTAIAMAQQGGMGVLHRNMGVGAQVQEVKAVKRAATYIIHDPITVSPDKTIGHAKQLMQQNAISGIPVVDDSGQLFGIVTNRDIRFEQDQQKLVKNIMTHKNLVTASPDISLQVSKELLQTHRIEKLLIVDAQGFLRGLITIRDIEQHQKYPQANKDASGRLRVAAAVGTTEDTLERVDALYAAGIDAVVVDTAHAHTQKVLKVIETLRERHRDLELVAGNIATAEAARELIDLGVNGVKVGIGPGSICTTRIIAGVGMPQLSAIMEVAEVTQAKAIPLIADGGIKYSGDIVKALAAGASSVMIGSLFAGTDESPGEKILYQGRTYKSYRGMGSKGAMDAGISSDRYFQEGYSAEKLVPEGIEGRVPYRGKLKDQIYQLVGGIRSGMGYIGAANLGELTQKAQFIRVSPAGLREGHVHDVIITKETSNYHME